MIIKYMKYKTKNRILNASLGFVIVCLAFFSVVGNAFKRMGLTETVQNTEQVVTLPTQNSTTLSENSTIPETTNKNEVPAPKPVTPSTKPSSTSSDTSVTGNSSTSSPSPSSVTPSGYTLAQVSTHDSSSSCWSAINTEVFDLTNWVNRHPGGKASILMICGKDGSALFNMQHGRSGRVNTILEGFKIGNLKA